jgi:hypothetical protein
MGIAGGHFATKKRIPTTQPAWPGLAFIYPADYGKQRVAMVRLRATVEQLDVVPIASRQQVLAHKF